MNSLAKFAKKQEKDSQRIKYSNINWIIKKEEVINTFNSFIDDAKSYGIDLFLYDYKENNESVGYDGVNIQFNNKWTGNRVIKNIDGSVNIDVHSQKGSALSVVYSSIGSTEILLQPSISEDSLAKHDTLFIYNVKNPSKISQKMLRKSFLYLLSYQQYTGVLHKPSLSDRTKIQYLIVKNFFRRYLDSDKKLKRYLSVYIPTLTIIITFVGAVISTCTFISVHFLKK